MSTTWDAVLVRGVAAELDRRLQKARVRGVLFDPAGKGVFLFLRDATLEFRLGGSTPEIHWTGPVEPFPEYRPLPAEVVGVSSPPDERRLTISLRRRRGAPRAHRLEIELMPRRSNVIWTAGDRVEAVLKPSRRVERGQPYAAPESTGRAHADGKLSAAEWTDFLSTLPDEDRARAAIERLAWASPVNVSALLGEGDGPGWGLPLWRQLVAQRAEEPVFLGPDPSAPRYPVPLGDRACTPADTVLTRFAPDSRPALPGLWLSDLKREAKRRRKTVRALERELENAHQTAGVRGEADLLLARLHDIPAGAAQATLEGFDGETVSIELDPRLSPHENAERIYRKAKKAEKAIETLPARIETAQAALGALEAQWERCQRGEWTERDVQTLAARRSAERGKGRPQLKRAPYRAFVSTGGIPILVGRGARFNDELTFKVARPRDVWLHARDAAGAHVVLRWESDESPPARDLEEAAVLAALHSGARHSSVVPVDWTRRRYVRKPRRAAPGTVLPDRVKTIFVEPDRELMERLAKSDRDPS